MTELLIKNGTVIDGTGAPRYAADVRVADGRIREIGKGLAGGERVIDAEGLIVAPGMIDPHTHMDGQLFWEPKGTSSSWHGVTTVLTGLCGYSLAPVVPEHRDYILHMFSRVEEVSPRVFQLGLPWDWQTFGEYLDRLDRGLGLNVASMVGHSTLRYHVMGAEAIARPATDDEVGAMRRILRESIMSGAFGFTSARAPAHVDWNGTPVPSRWAAPAEVIALASELRDLGSTAIGLIPQGLFAGFTEEDLYVIREAARASAKPVQLNGTLKEDAWRFMAERAEEGLTVYGITSSQPFYRYWTLEGTNTFNSMPTWREVMGAPLDERKRGMADPALRETLRREVDLEPDMDATHMLRPRLVWDTLTVAHVDREENRPLEGLSIPELARRQGKHKADAILDLALSEDLKTRFLFRFESEAHFLDPAKAPLFRHPLAVPMNSDAGAHLASECKTGEGTYFLRKWVLDNAIMSLEEGIAKLTSLPARMIGLTDRGVLREGLVADLMVFDPSEVDCLPKEPSPNDLPGGETRWVQRSRGIRYVLVNGEPTIWDGQETGALPGKVLRSGWYR